MICGCQRRCTVDTGCDVDFVLDEHLADVGRWDVVAEDADELLFQIVENLLAGTVLLDP
jgi:hypothetical protein